MSSIFDRDVREKFRRSGYVLTAQRRTVLRALRKAKGHPSVEDVYLVVKEDNPRVALGTVYQALSVLEEMGLIEAKHWPESPFCRVEGQDGLVRSRARERSTPPTSPKKNGTA